MEHLQPIPPITIPNPPPAELLEGFANVPINWGTKVSISIPSHLNRWLDYEEQDRMMRYKRPDEYEARLRWTDEYREAQRCVIDSLPDSFLHSFAKLANLKLGYGQPFDLFVFIHRVEEVCASLEIRYPRTQESPLAHLTGPGKCLVGSTSTMTTSSTTTSKPSTVSSASKPTTVSSDLTSVISGPTTAADPTNLPGPGTTAKTVALPTIDIIESPSHSTRSIKATTTSSQKAPRLRSSKSTRAPLGNADINTNFVTAKELLSTTINENDPSSPLEWSDTTWLAGFDPDSCIPSPKRPARSGPDLNKTPRLAIGSTSRNPISLQSSVSSSNRVVIHPESTELPSYAILSELAKEKTIFDALPICCMLCAASHYSNGCTTMPQVIYKTNKPFYVERVPGTKPNEFNYKVRGTGRPVCGSYNINWTCKRGLTCPWPHICSLCGDGHPSKRCPVYRQQELRDSYRANKKPVPIEAHPLIPIRYRLTMKPAGPPIPPSSDTYIYTDDPVVYPYLPKVEVRTNSVMNLAPEHVIEACPYGERTRLRSLFARLGELPSVEAFTKARADDLVQEDLLHQEIALKEETLVRNKDYNAFHFTCKTVENRYQFPDGSPTAAPIVLMLHYPSAHTDSIVLTDRAPATRLIRSHQIMPPANDKPSLHAVYNLFPVKVEAEWGVGGGIKTRRMPTDANHRNYPERVLAIAVKRRVNDLYSWLLTGQTKMVLLFGSSNHTVNVKKDFLALAQPKAKITSFVVARKILKDWEMNIETPELSIIRQDCQVRSTPFPRISGPDPLYPYQAHFRRVGYGLEPKFGPQNPDTSTIFSFTLVRLHDQDSGILLVNIPHPESAQHKVTDRQTTQEFDMLLGMVRNLLHRTNGLISYPASTILSRIRAGTEDETLEGYKAAQEGYVQDGRVKWLRPEVLPIAWRNLGERVERTEVGDEEVGEDIKTGMRDNFLALVEFAITETRPISRNRVPSYDPSGAVEHPAKIQQVVSARDSSAKKRIAKSKKLANDKTSWPVVCLCGVASESSMKCKVTGVPIMSRRTAAGEHSLHPANSIKRVGQTCLCEIPIDPDLRQKALVRSKSGALSTPSAEVRASCEEAVRKYHDQEGASPIHPDTWKEWKEQEKGKRSTKGKEKAMDVAPELEEVEQGHPAASTTEVDSDLLDE